MGRGVTGNNRRERWSAHWDLVGRFGQDEVNHPFSVGLKGDVVGSGDLLEAGDGFADSGGVAGGPLDAHPVPVEDSSDVSSISRPRKTACRDTSMSGSSPSESQAASVWATSTTREIVSCWTESAHG